MNKRQFLFEGGEKIFEKVKIISPTGKRMKGKNKNKKAKILVLFIRVSSFRSYNIFSLFKYGRGTSVTSGYGRRQKGYK